MQIKTILQNIIVTVGTGIVVAVLGIAWNSIRKGAAIHALGGMTREEIEAMVHQSSLPNTAIVAFNAPGCPAGWREKAGGVDDLQLNDGIIIGANNAQDYAQLGSIGVFNPNDDPARAQPTMKIQFVQGRSVGLKAKKYLYCINQ